MKTHYKLNCGKLVPLDVTHWWISCYDCKKAIHDGIISERLMKDSVFRNIVTTSFTLGYKYIIVIRCSNNGQLEVSFDYSNIPITDKLSMDKVYEKV